MSDRPFDTPFDQFSLDEISEMTNTELMDRGIALHEFGVDGWLDNIVQQATVSMALLMVRMQLIVASGDGDDEQIASQMHAAVSQIIQAVADTARTLGQREGRGEV